MSQTTSNSLYLQVKPAGAYHCVCDANQDAASRIVSYLLGQETTPLFSLESIAAWLDGNEPKAREILRHMQKLQWLQWVSEPQSVKDGKLEDILPGILAPLSMSEKSLLADNQGFYIASNGIPHETAEELSALSADLASLYERHRGLLNGNLNRPDNWAIVDAAGFSQLGFWPLHVGNELFLGAMMKQFPEIKFVLKTLPHSQKGHLGFMVQKDKPELVAEINAGLKAIKANGKFDEIKQKWIGDLDLGE